MLQLKENRPPCTSGAATINYYHHHTVQVTILRPPHAFPDENDCHHHQTVQVTISQPPPPVPVEYLCQLVTKKTTSARYSSHNHMQVTVAPGQYTHHLHHNVPESKCTQWLKKKTTSASYSRSEPAPLPLEFTLQQANVTCLRACH